MPTQRKEFLPQEYTLNHIQHISGEEAITQLIKSMARKITVGDKRFRTHRITESQNHRMFGVGRYLCGSSSPPPLLKQGHLQQAAQDFVQASLEYLQRWRIHSLPGQPVPGLCHPQSEEVLPHVHTELPVLQFVLIAPCPVAGLHWKESGPILLTPTLQIFISIYEVPSQPSLLQEKQAQFHQSFLIGEMLQSLHHPRSPPLDSLQ